MTWLVTGGSGFLGRHLLDRLETEPVNVVTIGRQPIHRPHLRWLSADLTDLDKLTRVVANLAPSVVFHLAGKTPPAHVDELDMANRSATAHLFEALARIGRPTRVIVAGSAAELGPVDVADLPVSENYPAQPDTDYGRSKLAATLIALSATHLIETVVARVFNPIGPGLPTTQALGRFAALIAVERLDTIRTGNLNARRDFIDVRDVADALLALARSTTTGLFHVGTGRSWSVGVGLDRLIALSGRSIRVVRDDTPARGPADSRADIAKLKAATGWTPRIDFEQSLADLFAAAKSGRD